MTEARKASTFIVVVILSTSVRTYSASLNRRWSKIYKAIKINAVTLIPEVVDVDFEVRQHKSIEGDWIHITRGGVTGYESANVRELVKDYPRRSVFDSWTACGGTLNKYNRLMIPISEIIKFLESQGLIEVKYEYGYPKEIVWKEVE